MTLLDPGKANRCPKETFMKVCKDIGCEEYSKKLFKSRRALALTVTIQVSRYRKVALNVLAVHGPSLFI